MFSDEQGDRGARPPASVIVLSVDQFEVIFQVTHQLPNFQESRLMELGCTAADRQTLIDALREIDARVAGASRVCIWLRDDEAESTVEVQISSGEVNDAGAPSTEVIATLPLRIGRRWYALAQLVVSSLGSRELFLRTGYGADEVRAAVVGLDLD
ncbi:hypothetical protein E5083_30030 [Streptomyces bauhiniae]|uniref:Uncharacterized protein n=1 Tax=Streptomyces bauhiniae TaxID=2340725 RepID=A0A4Z1CTY0_9ACTN|nr:hypothetical protein [Streptomyces bauhiniae]TGN72332.1 hypothetical protein E5083_30030 [Streptomyces bauhiniae]